MIEDIINTLALAVAGRREPLDPQADDQLGLHCWLATLQHKRVTYLRDHWHEYHLGQHGILEARYDLVAEFAERWRSGSLKAA